MLKLSKSETSGRENWRVFAFAAVSMLLFSGSGQMAQAAEGDLDLTFGNGGKVFTDFSGNSDDYGFAVALQPDGRIVVVGQSGVYPLFHSALARYDSVGGLDTTFGTGGKVIAALDSGGDGLSAIALQPDGKIVAAGSLIHNNWTTAFLLARFNPDGSRDQAFASNGSIVTSFGDSSAAAHAVVLQPDGKIIVVGVSGAGPYSELNDFALARYNSNGSLDTSFGNGGKLKTHFPGVYNTGSNATSAALQPDGRLVVAGAYKNESSYREFALARYNVNGSLDATFGSGGILTTSMGNGGAIALFVVLLPNGRIVLTGYFEAGRRNHDFALASYSPSGTLDQSFGNGGRVTTDLFGSSDDIASALALQSDGKLIVAGRTGLYPSFDVGLARYNSNGQLDQSFGTGGKVSSNFSNRDEAYAVALQRDGRIVVAGLSDPSGNTFDFTLARYFAVNRKGSSPR
jgi:uncharacterized delta-60 repeat protein